MLHLILVISIISPRHPLRMGLAYCRIHYRTIELSRYIVFLYYLINHLYIYLHAWIVHKVQKSENNKKVYKMVKNIHICFVFLCCIMRSFLSQINLIWFDLIWKTCNIQKSPSAYTVNKSCNLVSIKYMGTEICLFSYRNFSQQFSGHIGHIVTPYEIAIIESGVQKTTNIEFKSQATIEALRPNGKRSWQAVSELRPRRLTENGIQVCRYVTSMWNVNRLRCEMNVLRMRNKNDSSQTGTKRS